MFAIYALAFGPVLFVGKNFVKIVAVIMISQSDKYRSFMGERFYDLL